MTGFDLSTWSDIATLLGFVIAVVGLYWAIKEARGAKSASKAAEAAASETKDQITQHLQVVDLQRAIGLIERIKTLHDNERWEASREHYQPLRALLSDVIARLEGHSDLRTRLANSRTILRNIENRVRRHTGQEISEKERSSMNQNLNNIQTVLEELVSNVGLGDLRGEMK